MVVPALETLIEVRGDARSGDHVEYIRFEGFDFAHTSGTALVFAASRHCEVVKCTIRDTGGDGIHLHEDCHYNRIAGNDITRTGGVGVHLLGAPFDHGRNSHNTVSNNHIWNYGVVDKNMGGIGIDGGEHNVVSHNLVHDSPRWALWINSGNDNVIEYNHMHHTNLETQDTGAIHTYTNMGGWDPHMDIETNRLSRGNAIRYNLIHDTGGYGKVKPGQWQYPFYSWGIYLDLASSGTHVYGKVVVRHPSRRPGDRRRPGQPVREQHLRRRQDGAGLVCQLGRPFPMEGNRIERNVISFSGAGARLYRPGTWPPRNATFDRNLIFSHGQPLAVSAAGVDRSGSWEWWLAQGMDVNSVVADPLFADAANRDYRLLPGSPAYGLGFAPIDSVAAGLYASPERATWPPTGIRIDREEPLTTPPPHEYRGPSRPGPRPQLRAPRRSDVAVDGEVNEWPWEDGQLAVVLQQSWDGFEADLPASYACAAYDSEALYLAVRNSVADADSLVTGRGWGRNDGVEIALQDVSGPAGPILNLYGYPDGSFESVTEAGATPAQAESWEVRRCTRHRSAASAGAANGACPGKRPESSPPRSHRLWFNIGVRKSAGGGGWIAWEGTGAQNYVVAHAGDLVLVDD